MADMYQMHNCSRKGASFSGDRLDFLTLAFFFCYVTVQVAACEESISSILFAFCIEETCFYRRNSREARTGLCSNF